MYNIEIRPVINLPLKCKGVCQMIAEGDTQVRCLTRGRVQVDIPVLGRLIEGAIVRQLETTFNEERRILNDYLLELSSKGA